MPRTGSLFLRGPLDRWCGLLHLEQEVVVVVVFAQLAEQQLNGLLLIERVQDPTQLCLLYTSPSPRDYA